MQLCERCKQGSRFSAPCWELGKAVSVFFWIECFSQAPNEGVKSRQMHDMQSKAWSFKILLTCSQTYHFLSHTHTHQPSLPVGLLFIHGKTRLGDHKYNFCQLIRLGVSNEETGTAEFRGVKRWGGKWKLSYVSVTCLAWASKEIRWVSEYKMSSHAH